MKTTVKIIDHLAPKNPPEKKIELVSCLQETSSMTEGHPYFYKSNYTDVEAKSLSRVAQVNVDGIEYDVIVMENSWGSQSLFLGHWNSGKS